MKKFLILLLFLILISCAEKQPTKVKQIEVQPPPQTKNENLLSEKIMIFCESLEKGEVQKDRASTCNQLFEEYFSLNDEEKKDPRLQGSLERLIELSLKESIKENLAPESIGEVEESPKEKLLDETTFLSQEELLETLKEVENAKATIKTGIPIPLENSDVIKYIGLYQTKLRKWFSESLQRGAPYINELQTIFKDEGIPPELVYLAIVESAFKTNTRSKANAVGMWQFMEGTGKKYGLNIDFFQDERLDPIASARASAKYLKFLYDSFGDWNLALASYNCGEGKIFRYLRHHSKADFWTIKKDRVLKRETREYVPAILGAIVIASNPQSFNFSIEDPPQKLDYAVFKVNFPIDLRGVANELQIPIEHLLILNPSLKRIVTPNREYELKVPANLYEKAENYLKRREELKVDYVIHQVRRGETLRTIAKKYGVDPSEIIEANLSIPKRLNSKTSLLILKNGVKSRVEDKKEIVENKGTANTPEKAETFYEVKRGDTLSKIANKFGKSIDEICKENNISKRTVLRIGMKLKIPE
jgi:membrane-bound lytic murein transglycosylase D